MQLIYQVTINITSCEIQCTILKPFSLKNVSTGGQLSSVVKFELNLDQREMFETNHVRRDKQPPIFSSLLLYLLFNSPLLCRRLDPFHSIAIYDRLQIYSTFHPQQIRNCARATNNLVQVMTRLRETKRAIISQTKKREQLFLFVSVFFFLTYNQVRSWVQYQLSYVRTILYLCWRSIVGI